MNNTNHKLGQLLNGLSALCFGVVMAFLVGETGARLYVFGWSAFNYQKVNSFDNLFRTGLLRQSTVEGLDYELVPDFNGSYKLTSFNTNEHGMRDEPCNKGSDSTVYRIAMIGDSFTMGTGVEHENLFHTIVENKLNQKSELKNYQLLNFGIGGYGLPQYTAQLKNKVMEFTPNEVVIGFCGYNDHFIPTAKTKANSQLSGVQANGFWTSYLEQLAKLRWYGFDPKELKHSKAQLEYVENQLTALDSLCRENGIPMSVVYLSNVYKPQEASDIAHICIKLGIKFSDTSIKFEETKLNDYVINALDAHPNKEAHLLFSEVLLEHLSKTSN